MKAGRGGVNKRPLRPQKAYLGSIELLIQTRPSLRQPLRRKTSPPRNVRMKTSPCTSSGVTGQQYEFRLSVDSNYPELGVDETRPRP